MLELVTIAFLALIIFGLLVGGTTSLPKIWASKTDMVGLRGEPQVTPEMIEAGLQELSAVTQEPSEDAMRVMLARVYLAMHEARKRSDVKAHASGHAPRPSQP